MNSSLATTCRHTTQNYLLHVFQSLRKTIQMRCPGYWDLSQSVDYPHLMYMRSARALQGKTCKWIFIWPMPMMIRQEGSLLIFVGSG